MHDCLQISTLISHRERPLCSDRSLRAVARVGQAVNLAVERFVTVGETIADDNPEIKQEMYEACKEARVAGKRVNNFYAKIVIYGENERQNHTSLCFVRKLLESKQKYMFSRRRLFRVCIKEINTNKFTIPITIF